MFEVIKDILLVLVAFTGIVTGVYYNRKVLIQKQQEDERKEIYKKLNEFYGPIRQLLEQSRKLNVLFKQSDAFERSSRERPRTLIALLEGEKFEGNDKILLKEILGIVSQARDVMYEKSGLIDDEDIMQELVDFSLHVRMLHLAYEGQLASDIKRFQGYVFPEKLDAKIKKRIDDLQQRLKVLNEI